MRNNFYWLIFAILIFSRCSKKNEYDEYITTLNLQSQQIQELIYTSWGETLSSSINLEDFNLKKISILQLISKDNILIFRFPNVDCNPCTQDLLNIVKIANDSLNIKNIVVIVSTGNIRHFKAFAQKIYPVKCYNLYEDDIHIPIESIGLPYIFILKRQSLTPICLFVPRKEFKEESLRYINLLSLKLKE